MKLQLTYNFDSEEELRAHLAVETRSVDAPAEPAREPEAEVTPSEPEVRNDEPQIGSVDDEPQTGSVDGDGMPYDISVHSDPPSFTADGLWRAKRGKGEEAKAARAAFKAKGGNVEPPATLPTEAPVGMPGMPGALPADAPEPISMERAIEKITGMLQRGTIDEKALAGLYTQHSGVNDPAQSYQVFNTNETARAALFNALCEIEPELK